MRFRRRNGQWRGLVATALTAAAAAGLVVLALERFDPAAQAPPTGSIVPAPLVQAPPDASAPEPAQLASAAAAPDATESAKLQDSIPAVPEPEPSYDDVELEPPFLILDGQSFSAGKWAISLRDVLSPPRDAICHDRNDELFACGLQARAALSNLLRAGKVNCHVRLPPIHGRFEASCLVGNDDLAEALVGRGWLRPTGTHERLEAALHKARDAQAGLWNGGWRLRQQP